MALFRSLNVEKGITILLVTHDPGIAAHANRLITFRDGAVVSDERSRNGAAVIPAVPA
jgi:ABC-type lipoprotein export system ATPase subunit